MRIALVTLLVTLGSHLAEPATMVRTNIAIRPSCEISGAEVKLSDIGTVQCADQAAAARLSEITVCGSPLPGKSREITRQQILTALRRSGIADGSYGLLCPQELAVKRRSSVVTGQMLFEAARDYALSVKSWPGTAAGEPVRLIADQEAPLGKLELRAKCDARTVRKGRISLPIEIVVDGQVYRTVHVPVLIKVLAPVLVSTRDIKRSEEITGNNCALQERDITLLPDDIMTEEASPASTAAVPIAEGQVIRKSWVSQPPAIRSGDAVVVVVRSGPVRVTDKGFAAQDGRVGDGVKVRLLTGTREVRGTVVEPGVVEIRTGRRNQS